MTIRIRYLKLLLKTIANFEVTNLYWKQYKPESSTLLKVQKLRSLDISYHYSSSLCALKRSSPSFLSCAFPSKLQFSLLRHWWAPAVSDVLAEPCAPDCRARASLQSPGSVTNSLPSSSNCLLFSNWICTTCRVLAIIITFKMDCNWQEVYNEFQFSARLFSVFSRKRWRLETCQVNCLTRCTIRSYGTL